MSGKSILTIYGKEMLELSRDRRTLISMIVVPLAAIPVLFMVMSYFMTAREKTAESEAVTVAVQANLRTPGLAAALRGAGMALVTVADAREAMPAPEIFKVSIEEVVSAGLGAVMRDRARVIPGWLVCVVMTITSLVPFFLLRFFLTQRRGEKMD